MHDTLVGMFAAKCISPDATFFLIKDMEGNKDGRVSFPSIIQVIEAIGKASARQRHFITFPFWLQEDSGWIIGASRKRG